MDLSETADSICIHTQDGTVLLSYEESFELLAFLYQLRDKLYQAMQHPDEEEQMHLRMQQGMLARYGAREEIETWREVGASEREQASKHTSATPFQESLEKPWLPIQPGEEF